MAVFNVTYTVYPASGGGAVISEGTIPVNTSSSYMAEQTVKAMFSGNEVIIRSVTNG